MKKCLCLILPLLVIGAAHAQNPPLDTPVAPPALDKIELKPRWMAGQKYLQTMHSVAKSSQTIDKKRMDMTQDMTMGMLYEIKNVDAQGAASMELTYRSIQMKMHMQNGTDKMDTSYASQHPPKNPDPSLASLAGLIGLKFQMKMAPDGTLLQLQGIDEMRKRMIKAMKLPSGANNADFEAFMKKQLSDESIRKMIEQKSGFSNTYVYPGKSVAVGESWTRKVTFDVPVPMSSTATYTLRDHADGMAHLDLTSKFTINSTSLSPVKTIKVGMKMSGNQTGTVNVRESDGQISNMQTSLRYAGTVTSTGPDARAPKKIVTQSWPIYAVVTVTMESKDLP